MGEKAVVARDDLDHVVFQVKQQCKDGTQRLIEELDNWFPDVDFLNALAIVHPRYWMKEDTKGCFDYHLYVIKDHLFEANPIAIGGLNGVEQQIIDPPVNYKL